MTWFALLKTALFGAASPPSAKRTAPPQPPSVALDGVAFQPVYATHHDDTGPSGLRAFIRASRAADGTVLWEVPIYEVAYEKDLETDVQDVFITRLALKAGQLRITDEIGRAFMLNLETRTVREADGRAA